MKIRTFLIKQLGFRPSSEGLGIMLDDDLLAPETSVSLEKKT